MIADQARRLTSTATTRKAAACWTERANALVEAALGLKDTVGIDLPDPDDIPPQRAGESLCDYEVRIGFRAPASAPVTSAPASAPLQAPAPAAGPLSLRVRVERAVSLRRGEEAPFNVALVPTAYLLAASEEERVELLRAAAAELASGKIRFLVRPADGEITFSDGYWPQWFTLEASQAQDWQYDGGEVQTSATRYRPYVEVL